MLLLIRLLPACYTADPRRAPADEPIPDACADVVVGPDPAATEVCGNGVDDDGDGSAAPCLASGSVAGAVEVEGPVSYANLQPAGSAGDLDGDCVEDLVVSYDLNGVTGLAIYPGRSRGVLGLEDAWAVLQPEESAWVAGALGGVDFDGDGHTELVTHALWEGEPAVVGLRPEPGFSSFEAVSYHMAVDGWGASTFATGDVDGDGQADLLAAGPEDSLGRGFVWHGPFGARRDEAEPVWAMWSSDEEAEAVAAGDLDGDGLDEVILGVPDLEIEADARGAVLVLSAPTPSYGTAATAAEAVLLHAGETYADFGQALCAADLDRDGHADLAIAEDDGVYMVQGPVSGRVDVPQTGATLHVEGEAARWWAAVACGDLTGDSAADLSVGTSYEGGEASGSDPGAVRVYAGPITADWSEGDAIATVTGDGPVGLGTSLVLPGDPNADGIGDLLIGARSGQGVYGAGAAFLLYGGGL